MIHHIKDTINPNIKEVDRDKVLWMSTLDRKFNVKDSNDVLRRNKRANEDYTQIWNKTLPTTYVSSHGKYGKAGYLQMTFLLR